MRRAGAPRGVSFVTPIVATALFGTAALLPRTAAAAASPGRVWAYKYVLATARTERELAPITEHLIAERGLRERDLVDFAAEVLLANVADTSYPLENKFRLIRVLKAAKSPRYEATLDRIVALRNTKEIAAAVKSARVNNRNGEPQYVPGSVDIQAIVAEMDAAALAARPTTAQGEHLAGFRGQTIDDLLEWAGRPQQIVMGQTRVTDGMLIVVKVQRLSFFYRGLGRAVFGYQGKKGWKFQAVVADPLAFEQEFSYRDRARELGMPDTATLAMIQLASGHAAAMKIAVEGAYRRGTASREFIDTASEILATQYASTDDPFRLDVYAWICRLLADRGGPRYATVLYQVEKGTRDEKLRRYAGLPVQPTNEVPVVQYQPGTISLAAQRAKYPSPYPGSNYESGHL
jgi:hypothetical protein